MPGDEEDGELEAEKLRHTVLATLFGVDRLNRVTEPELDMKRPLLASGGGLTERLQAVLRWFVPGGDRIGPPTRSVDRELQESWPGLDR